MNFRFRPMLAALVLTALFPVVAGCSSDEEKIARHREKGETYLAEGKHSEAIIEFRNIRQIDP